jgi:hypothetical protein
MMRGGWWGCLEWMGTYDAFGLSLALLEGMLVLKFGSHGEVRWVVF